MNLHFKLFILYIFYNLYEYVFWKINYLFIINYNKNKKNNDHYENN